jgi:hypothetical protein
MEWQFKRWDIRSDGKVFWQYDRTLASGQYWVTWDQALKYQSSTQRSRKKHYECQVNKDRKKAYNKAWWESEKGRPYKKDHQRAYNHSPKYKEYRKTYEKVYRGPYTKRKRELDPMFAAICRLRARMAKAIKENGYLKARKTIEMVGCSKSDLKKYIESKFQEGMNWENKNLWHIDHIIPLASAKSVEELYKLNHYTNLQPLWAKDNMKKGKKLNTIKE